jgi:hypothetical protein
MPWAKIDDDLHGHPKVLSAGLEAMGLWVLAISWTAHYLTDGFIPDEQIARLGATQELAQRLVSAGMWEQVDGGYQIHDYLEYNPTGDKVRAEREAAKERMRNLRNRQGEEQEDNGDEYSEEVLPNLAGSSSSPYPFPSPIPDPVPNASPANAGAAKPPPSDKPPKKPTPPAVQVFRENAHRYPPKAWYDDIAATVSEGEAELARWGAVVKAYVGCGWNPTNVSGMLGFFQRGEIPKPGKRAPPDSPQTPEERRKRYASQPGVIT